MADVFADILRKSIKRIRIRSAFGPDIDLDDPFAPGPPDPVLQQLQPQITFETSGGEVVIEPYGTPPPTQWENVKAAGIVAGGGLGILSLIGLGTLVYLGVRALRKRRAGSRTIDAIGEPV